MNSKLYDMVNIFRKYLFNSIEARRPINRKPKLKIQGKMGEMELNELVSYVLADLINGVESAQSKSPPGTIVPVSELIMIEFEVAIRANKHRGGVSELSVLAAFLGGKIKGDKQQAIGEDVIIKFPIPVRLPVSEANWYSA